MMKWLISIALYLSLLPPLALAQAGTTIAPKTTVLANTTLVVGTSPGPALVGSIGTAQSNGPTITSLTTGTGSGATAFSCAAGDGVALGFFQGATVTGTASDSASNSGWNVLNATPYGAGGYYLTWFYNLNLTSSISSVTVSFASTAIYAAIHAFCLSGLAGHTDFAQVQNSFGSTPATIASGSYSTTAAKEIVLSIQVNTNDNSCSTATSPAVLGSNYETSIGFSSLYTIYSSTQSSITQGCVLNGAPTGGGYIATMGLY